jgi:hypothetical protein
MDFDADEVFLGHEAEILALVSPMPKPISRMVGAWRAKVAARSSGALS